MGDKQGYYIVQDLTPKSDKHKKQSWQKVIGNKLAVATDEVVSLQSRNWDPQRSHFAEF